MSMIYKRFTEKSAEEWRQIYKALQLLEYLVKNGSERVIDDARSHVSTIKMLRNFSYIDEKMKDQGLNVRNRAKELTELLQDSEAIRSERRKAKSNNKKFGAVSSDSAFSSGNSGGFGNSGKKYGGFSSEDYGSGSAGAVYGDGGGFSGSSGPSKIYGDGGGTSGTASPAYGEANSGAAAARREKERESRKKQRATVGFAEGALGSVQAPAERFDDYDEYEVGSSSGAASRGAAKTIVPKPIPKKAEAPPPKPKEVDLFSFDDEPGPAMAPVKSNAPMPPKISTQDDDDEFDDFQSASTTMAAPQPVKAASLMNVMGPASPLKPQFPNFNAPPATASQSQSSSRITSSSAQQSAPVMDFLGMSSMPSMSAPQSPAIQQAARPTGPNYYASGLFQTQTQGNTLQAVPPPTAQAKPKPAGGDAFGDLLAGFKRSNTPKGESLAEMNKKSASAGIWGAPAKPAVQSATTKTAFNDDDDDFGDFTKSSNTASQPSNGGGNNTDLLF